METVKEGNCLFEIPKDVFYNKVQIFNRDLTIGCIRTFQEQLTNEGKLAPITILDAFSASGLRAIRYAKELKGLQCVYANDLSPSAVSLITRNSLANQTESLVVPQEAEAGELLSTKKNKFDVIDLDPYGSAAPFTEPAIKNIRTGGLLCVTCTDMAVLCGNHPETCFAKYGSAALRGAFCHEQALRIVLGHLGGLAARHGRTVIPLLSLSADFYIRLFVIVKNSSKEAKKTSTKMGLVAHCGNCHYFSTNSLCSSNENSYKAAFNKLHSSCPVCESSLRLSGPLWLSDLHNKNFLERLVDNSKEMSTFRRIQGLVALVEEEIATPLYFTLPKLAHSLGCSVPAQAIVHSALLNGGYLVSGTHANPNGLKTTAPLLFIYAVLWEIDKKTQQRKETVLATKIKGKCSEIVISLEKRADSVAFSKRNNLLRFQQNPEPHWGPKAACNFRRKNKSDRQD